MLTGLKFVVLSVYTISLVTTAVLLPAPERPPSAVREIRVPSGETADLWLEINVTGKVYYAIRTRDGKNNMRMWWIMKPLGNVKQLGVLARDGSLDIPGKLKGSLSAKLRGKAAVDTVVYIRENVKIENFVTFQW